MRYQGDLRARRDNCGRDSALIDVGLNANLNGQVCVYCDYMIQAGVKIGL